MLLQIQDATFFHIFPNSKLSCLKFEVFLPILQMSARRHCSRRASDLMKRVLNFMDSEMFFLKIPCKSGICFEFKVIWYYNLLSLCRLPRHDGSVLQAHSKWNVSLS